MVELYQYITLRNIGIPVKKLIELKAEATQEALQQMLVERERTCMAEADRQRLLADCIQEMSHMQRFAVQNMGRYWLDTVPKGTFISFVVNQDRQPVYSETAIAWRKQTPLTQLAILSDPAQTAAEPVNWGIYCASSRLSQLSSPVKEESLTFEDKLCLCTAVYIPLCEEPAKHLQSLHEEASASAYELTGWQIFFHLDLRHGKKKTEELLLACVEIAKKL